MRASAVERTRVLLLLPVFVFLVLMGTHTKIYVDGVVRGDVGTDGVDLCVEEDPLEGGPLEEQQEELGVEQELTKTCLRTSFCAGVGFDATSQRVCPPID